MRPRALAILAGTAVVIYAILSNFYFSSVALPAVVISKESEIKKQAFAIDPTETNHTTRSDGGLKPYISKESEIKKQAFAIDPTETNHTSDGGLKPYTPWNGTTRHGWCVPQVIKLKAYQLSNSGSRVVGLIYAKSPKAASSTAAGITMQMAHNIAARKFNITAGEKNPLICTHNWTHPFAFFNIHARRKDPSLLWTIVRQPSKHALSIFFHFAVGRKGLLPTSQNMIEKLEAYKSAQFLYITKNKGTPKNLKRKQRKQNGTYNDYVLDLVRDGILNFYDFVGVVERMEESLVVMKILFDLEFRDVIVLSAKQSGGYDDGGMVRKNENGVKENVCIKIPKAFTTPEVDQYLVHNFTKDNYDFVLYAAANRTLDLTIDALGRQRVETGVREYRMLMKLAEHHCQSKTVFPCSAEGKYQRSAAKESCFAMDSGCGHKCVQHILEKHEQGLL
jgi:hypothetical protein